jgi:hypothetical protein
MSEYTDRLRRDAERAVARNILRDQRDAANPAPPRTPNRADRRRAEQAARRTVKAARR